MNTPQINLDGNPFDNLAILTGYIMSNSGDRPRAVSSNVPAPIDIRCSGSCQVACQGGCETACQTACQLGTSCQTVCQLNCQVSCQTTCELSCQNCQTACQLGSSCQTACQLGTCQTACQLGSSCQTTCQVSCQNCQGSCQDACQLGSSCQTACQLGTSCQNACQLGTSCQDSCQLSCQVYCQIVDQTCPAEGEPIEYLSGEKHQDDFKDWEDWIYLETENGAHVDCDDRSRLYTEYELKPVSLLDVGEVIVTRYGLSRLIVKREYKKMMRKNQVADILGHLYWAGWSVDESTKEQVPGGFMFHNTKCTEFNQCSAN